MALFGQALTKIMPQFANHLKVLGVNFLLYKHIPVTFERKKSQTGPFCS
jgi:hypothetical protein